MNARRISISRSGHTLTRLLRVAVLAPVRTARRTGVLQATLVVLIGSVLGLGLFTVSYADGTSYLGDDPATCANCHVMRENYNSYLKSSHGKVATCNDCHTPAGLVPKYVVKAQNGWSHSFAFTTQRFPDAIRITDRQLKVVESSCLKCHKDTISGIQATRSHNQQISCVQCHRDVGHE